MSEFVSETAKKAGDRDLTKFEVMQIHAEYRQWSDKEITTLRQQLEQAQARVAELEEGVRGITKYPDVREYVGTICHDAALSALKGSDGAWLLRKQAEAVDEVNRKLTEISEGMDGRGMDPVLVMQYAASTAGEEAQRLRQQADEAERAGGEK